MNSPHFQIALAFTVALFIVFYSIPIVVRIAKAKHLFDEPNHRRVNKVPIPSLGGISIFLGIILATLFGLKHYVFIEFRYILISSIILFFIGIKDDLLVISARKKFIAQLFCAFVLITVGDIRFTNLHGVLGMNELDYFSSYIITTLAYVSIINALNLIDGIDGLASSIGILASLVLGVGLFIINEYNFAVLSFAIAGSLIGFFIFNVFGKKNKIFMGDTGSLLIGLMLSVLIIHFNECSITNYNLNNFSPALTLSLVAIPLFDMIRLFFSRMIKKKSPFAPDMNHIHHRFLRLGLSHKMTTLTIFLFTLLLLAIVVSMRNIDNNFALLFIAGFVLAFMYLPLFISNIDIARKVKNEKMELEAQVVSQSDFIHLISPEKESKTKKVLQEEEMLV